MMTPETQQVNGPHDAHGIPDAPRARHWAVTLLTLRAIAANRLRATPAVWAARGKATSRPHPRGSIDIVPIQGLLTPRGSWWGTSIDSVRANLRAAVASESRAVVLDVDSPGGEVYQIEELAAEIRQARGTKPIIASVNSLAASAAYWLASQADELVVTPSGEVGSIGVYGVHEDLSRALDMAGVTISLIAAGEGKLYANPFERLSDPARAELQGAVDRYYGAFLTDIARGRRAPIPRVRDVWQARMFGAAEAVALGLADRVGSIGIAIDRASTLGAQRARVTATALSVDLQTRQILRRSTRAGAQLASAGHANRVEGVSARAAVEIEAECRRRRRTRAP
jgi:signal peptide peptidase SppA